MMKNFSISRLVLSKLMQVLLQRKLRTNVSILRISIGYIFYVNLCLFHFSSRVQRSSVNARLKNHPKWIIFLDARETERRYGCKKNIPVFRQNLATIQYNNEKRASSKYHRELIWTWTRAMTGPKYRSTSY